MSGQHTTWLREGLTVYALQPAGYRKGVEQFQNRWSFHVQSGPGSAPEELERVAVMAAAAPALLEALKVAREEIDGLRDDFHLPRDSLALDVIDAALIAATHPAQAPVEEE